MRIMVVQFAQNVKAIWKIQNAWDVERQGKVLQFLAKWVKSLMKGNLTEKSTETRVPCS